MPRPRGAHLAYLVILLSTFVPSFLFILAGHFFEAVPKSRSPAQGRLTFKDLPLYEDHCPDSQVGPLPAKSCGARCEGQRGMSANVFSFPGNEVVSGVVIMPDNISVTSLTLLTHLKYGRLTCSLSGMPSVP
jgi:hypothetical protein